jgi:hypothetical protein
MKVQLVKREDRWDLYETRGHKIASSLDGCAYKLSLKNCEAIELGYNLDELASEYAKKREDLDLVYANGLYYGFLEGFQKALELMGDKKFSEEDLRNAMNWIMTQYFEFNEQPTTGRSEHYLQSLQQTEWKVEIIKEESKDTFGNAELTWYNPKLDADGCLILKKKENG